MTIKASHNGHSPTAWVQWQWQWQVHTGIQGKAPTRTGERERGNGPLTGTRAPSGLGLIERCQIDWQPGTRLIVSVMGTATTTHPSGNC